MGRIDRALVLVWCAVVAGCERGIPVSPDLPTDELWVLVHPTDAPPDGPGVVRLDGSGAEIARLPLPAKLISPTGWRTTATRCG